MAEIETCRQLAQTGQEPPVTVTFEFQCSAGRFKEATSVGSSNPSTAQAGRGAVEFFPERNEPGILRRLGLLLAVRRRSGTAGPRQRAGFDAPGSPSLKSAGTRHLRQIPGNRILARGLGASSLAVGASDDAVLDDCQPV